MATISIPTAQSIHLSFTAAPLASRLFATVIDLSIILSAVFLSSLLITIGGTTEYLSVRFIAGLVVYLIILLSPLLQESFLDGQTIGKKVLKIRVVKLDGSAPSIGDYFIRWMISLVELYLTLGAIAVLAYLITRNHQRFGDVAAGTVVVSIPSAVTVAALRVTAPANSKVVFSGVHMLTDSDIQVVREVLHIRDGSVDRVVAEQLREKTAAAITAKLRVSHEMGARQFLLQVLTDYAALHNKKA